MPQLFGGLEGGRQVRTERNIEDSRWTRPGDFDVAHGLGRRMLVTLGNVLAVATACSNIRTSALK